MTGTAREKAAPATLSAELFKKRVARWAVKIGVRPKQIYVQSMRKKWASCSTAGRVYFSTDLLAEPAAFQNGVIAHELLHLIVPNHGPLFKSYMAAFLPRKASLRMQRAPKPRLASAEDF